MQRGKGVAAPDHAGARKRLPPDIQEAGGHARKGEKGTWSRTSDGFGLIAHEQPTRAPQRDSGAGQPDLGIERVEVYELR